MNAHYTETSDPGLSLVLFALVRSNPPAHITWVDQSGQLVANTSDFLILDSRSYPWLTNHTLQVAPSSLSGNVSVNASNSVGAAQRNLPLAGLAGYYHFYPFLTMVPNQTVLHILFPVKGGRVTRPPEHSLVWPSSAPISSVKSPFFYYSPESVFSSVPPVQGGGAGAGHPDRGRCGLRYLPHPQPSGALPSAQGQGHHR